MMMYCYSGRKEPAAHISGAPVLDHKEATVGCISEFDLLKASMPEKTWTS
jgi:hypothetical protein